MGATKMVNQGIIETAKQYLSLVPAHYGLKKAFVFGSYAQNKAGEHSDIDVALVLESMPDFFSAQQVLMKLRRSVDLRIEPHPIKVEDFNRDNPFVVEIEATGVEIPL